MQLPPIAFCLTYALGGLEKKSLIEYNNGN
jgi:hypothetical protein